MVERIGVSVFPSHRPQLLYTHKLYAFETENACIEPLKLREICQQIDEQFDGHSESATNDKQTDLMFNHEWIHQKV